MIVKRPVHETPEVLVAELLDHVYEQIMKPKGFRKSGQYFRKTEDSGVITVVNLQRSKNSTKQQIQLTFNLGLYFPDLAPAYRSARVGKRPTDADCHFRQRIGSHTLHGSDRWWSVAFRSDLELATAESMGALERGLIHLESMNTPEKFLALPGIEWVLFEGAAAECLYGSNRATAKTMSRPVGEALLIG